MFLSKFVLVLGPFLSFLVLSFFFFFLIKLEF